MPGWLTDLLPAGWGAWQLTALAVGFAVVSAVGSVVAVGAVLARLPADYYVNRDARPPTDRHPVLKVLLFLGRNLLGYVLVALGVVMSLPGVPGQGVLTILMGLMLIDLPGKHRAERWLVTRRPVLAAVNRLRARVGKEPMRTDPANPPG